MLHPSTRMRELSSRHSERSTKLCFRKRRPLQKRTIAAVIVKMTRKTKEELLAVTVTEMVKSTSTKFMTTSTQPNTRTKCRWPRRPESQ